MKCHVCGKGPMDGTTVFRQNEKGVEGIWACEEHSGSVDLAVQVDVAIIEGTLKNDSE